MKATELGLYNLTCSKTKSCTDSDLTDQTGSICKKIKKNQTCIWFIRTTNGSDPDHKRMDEICAVKFDVLSKD